MSRIQPVDPQALPHRARERLAMAEAAMGFLPNSMLSMAHWPELLEAFGPLAMTIMGGGELDRGFKAMIAAVASAAAGCRYCSAHTTHSAARHGIAAEKIARVWEYQTSDLFDEAERAALDCALAAAQAPGRVEESHFEELKRHYTERQIVEILAVISLFGFLNRWNDSLDTPLENEPLEFVRRTFPRLP